MRSSESLSVVQSSESLSVVQSSESLSVVQSSESLSVVQSSESLSVVQSSESLSVVQSSERLSVVLRACLWFRALRAWVGECQRLTVRKEPQDHKDLVRNGFRLLPRLTIITGLGGRPSQDWEADHHRTGRVSFILTCDPKRAGLHV
ncbi:unnamed protein product [Arctogadus glacialis]